jgi:putative exosortase-associated protein (TIGR04073 family)
MKKFICSLLVASFATLAYGDIQDPPGADQGPTRKLGRAVSNILYGGSEIGFVMNDIDETDGNSAAYSYGILKGIGRTFAREGFGWVELITFPFPTYKGSYRPFYRSSIPWINGGYDEFPPELGFETKYHYSRQSDQY